MLPFPIITPKILPQWYEGSLLAFDDTLNVNSLNAGIPTTDLVGNYLKKGTSQNGTISVAPYTIANNPNIGKSLYYPDQRYGNFIQLDNLNLVSDVMLDFHLTQNWSIDFWSFRPTGNGQHKWSHQYLKIDTLNNIDTPSYLSFFNMYQYPGLVGDPILIRTKWNNNTYTNYSLDWASMTYSELFHFMVEYDSTNNKLYTYKNGILFSTLTPTISELQNTYWGTLTNNTVYLLRYRLKQSIKYKGSNFDINLIYK